MIVAATKIREKFSRTGQRLLYFPLLLLMLLVCSIAQAAKPGDLFMTPTVGSYSFANEQGLKIGSSAGLRFGLALLSKDMSLSEDKEQSESLTPLPWEIEWGIQKVATKRKSDGKNMSALLWDISALYHYKTVKRWDIFLRGGAGGSNLTLRGANPQLRYGVGARFPLIEKRLALQMDVQHLLDLSNQKIFSNFAASVGVTFIAPKVIRKIPKPPPPPPPDLDSDTLIDAEDRCPNTPRGEIVDETGCMLDQDHDGVSDLTDFCPRTLARMAVDQNGCPRDTDLDQVPDAFDKCQNTEVGTPVDGMGCPLDTDSDGFLDLKDLCPKTFGTDKTGCFMDQDGDGILDPEDRCKTTFGADKEGCPLDTDSDGVLDAFDLCPGTIAGPPVNSFGCPKTVE
ncbi:MAG: thrombospondin type 3 repeat-containing protein [Nitrospirota bacterium]